MTRSALAAALALTMTAAPTAQAQTFPFPPEAPMMESNACLSSWALLMAFLGATPPEGEPLAAPVTEEGHCRVDNVLVRSPRHIFHAERISWAASGLEALMQGALPDRIDLVAEGFGMLSHVDQPVWDYVMLAQSRASAGMALRLSVTHREGVVTVSQADIDFPDDSRASLTATLTGIDPATPAGALLQTARLDIHTAGLFERYLLAPIVTAYFDPALPMEPQADMQRAQATALVTALPEASFPPETRAAMAAFIADFPNPRGDLGITLDAPDGMRLTQLGHLGGLEGAEALASAFEGVQIGISYDPISEGAPD
ncbi:hypothetical protein [Pararhodobacter sp. CCB-MM2]|uniref:hypothetical protein n=1 Tax=Pararhodobacter sp. CCB-MM2 TaxID=1786003 RepID=UPI0008347BB1|nr:hypothetical protein [Pararhodobacter sp. CCB-MM2]